LNLPRKKGALIQKVNVSHGMAKTDKMVRVTLRPSMYRWRGAVLMSLGKKKSDEEAKKRQTNEKGIRDST
jgi:hypothetical protein